MVEIGDSFSNPVTREHFVWRATTSSTSGEYCEFELHLGGGAKVAAAHRHPNQIESFTLVSGKLGLKVGHDRRRVLPGEHILVPAGVAHAWGNTGEEPAHVIVRLTPAFLIEEYFQAFCHIAATGGAAASGLPKNPLQLAVLLDAHRGEFALPNPLAHAVASPLLAVLAAVGRSRGFRPDGTRGRAT